MALSVSLALDTVLFVLALAVRCGVPLSRVVSHQSDEIVLLTVFGAVLLVAGAAHRLQVWTAIWAFLVGIAVSGPAAEQTHRLLAPLRPNWVRLRFCDHCIFGATKACTRVLDSPAAYLELPRSQITGEVIQQYPESRNGVRGDENVRDRRRSSTSPKRTSQD